MSRSANIEQAWARVEAAFDLSDDGIVDWSVTLTHDSSGWHAEAWRSDTTTNQVGDRATAADALDDLADGMGAWT